MHYLKSLSLEQALDDVKARFADYGEVTAYRHSGTFGSYYQVWFGCEGCDDVDGTRCNAPNLKYNICMSINADFDGERTMSGVWANHAAMDARARWIEETRDRVSFD